MLLLCWARWVVSFRLLLASRLIDVQKARIVYAQRNFKEALRLFQDVLRYNPSCVPDPRIGIGLCFWAMDQKAKAKAAWHRSLEVVCNEYLLKKLFERRKHQNPGEWPALLLLGLESINASKNDHLMEAERTHAYVTGTKMVEKAFNINKKSAAAANALCELFLRKGDYKRVSITPYLGKESILTTSRDSN